MLSLMLAASSSPSTSQAPVHPIHLIKAEGVLFRVANSNWQVGLTPDQRLEGQDVGWVRFTADAFAEATWCEKFEGKNVEVSGEIKSISKGVATIALGSINVGMQPSRTVAETLRQLSSVQSHPGHHAPGQPLYRFAYYLSLLDPPDGCERCYVPLLIASEPLDIALPRQESFNVVWITTYERDSIWQIHGLALLTADAIERSSNTLRFRGRNYRYEAVADLDVLHLLEHPMGTISISRIFLPNNEAPGANINDLIADFHTMFRVRERRGWAGPVVTLGEAKPSGHALKVPEPAGSTSELTVFDDGKIEYRSAPGCTSRVDPDQMPKSHPTVENWNWRETCPGSQQVETNAQFSLDQLEFEHLKELLNREEVKRVGNCFCNAAGTFDDYEIEIPRLDSNQTIPVFNFMPQHFELREHPAITYLICEARTIAAKASHEEIPGWCHDLPRLK